MLKFKLNCTVLYINTKVTEKQNQFDVTLEFKKKLH